MPDPFEKPPEPSKFSTITKRILKVTKVVLITKLYMNLLLLIIIIILSISGFEYIKSNETGELTGNVVLETKCPECVCAETEYESNCDLCPVKTKVETKNIIKYQCPSGDVVEDLDDCSESFPEVSEESSGTVEGITLAIDNVEYERDDDDSGFVTRVDYTIINKGDLPIVPKIEVKVYEDWTLNVKKSVANKVINPEIVVVPDSYVSRSDRVRIFFNGEEQIVRLLLVDSLPTIEREIVAVTKDIELD